MVFLKVRGWILTAVFSVVGTAVAIQFGWLGPSLPFLTNLMVTAIIYIGSRVLSKIISGY